MKTKIIIELSYKLTKVERKALENSLKKLLKSEPFEYTNHIISISIFNIF